MSSNDRIFASGVAIKGSAGWWSLHHWEPPTPPRKLIIKHTFKICEEIVLSSDSEGTRDKDKDELQDMVNVMESHSESEMYEDLIVDESDGTGGELGEKEEQEQDHEKEQDKEKDILETAMGIDTVDATIAPPMVPSADLKQQLLERLLMMDSSLLHNAIKKAKAKKMAEIECAAKKKAKLDEAAVQVEPPEKIEIPLFTIPAECLQSLEEMTSVVAKRLTAFPVIRASPYENDLLKKCNRVDYQGFRTVARLRRKLLVRRQRRKVNLALFDLDNYMYLFLKTPESALLIDDNTLLPTPNPKQPSSSPNTLPIVFANAFDPQGIPYISDPSRSLYVKLTGMAAVYGTCPYPVTSPFTGKLLPEFIAEETAEDLPIPKLKLLNQIKSLTPESDCEQEDGLDCSPLLTPSSLRLPQPSPSPLTIKYTNLRKEFMGQLNDLLADSFWRGIDVSEALEYPDYAVVALVGLSVVGCAICNPEGYLSYLYVRPDFQGSNLSTRLLSLLLPLLTAKKDITLHVSAGNTPAMLLYQRIGFKPEEFIVNFYDKYLGIGDEEQGDEGEAVGTTPKGNKNAFFMRLKR